MQPDMFTDWKPYNGEPPHVAGSETSLEAAQKIKGKAEIDRARLLVYIKAHPECCDHEMQRDLNLEGSSQRPRRCELFYMGKIVRHGRKKFEGRAVTTWRAV